MKEEHLEKDVVQEVSLGDRLRENLDLVVFVVALLIAGLMVGGILFPRDEAIDASSSRLEEVKESVTSSLSGTTYDRATATEVVTRATQKVSAGWRRLERAAPEPSEALIYGAGLTGDLRAGRGNRIVFQKAEDVRASADRGEITVSWQEHPANNVSVAHWIINRRSPGQATREVAKVPGEEREYKDTTVQPGIEYTYTVIAESDDPALASQGRARSEPSDSVTQQGVADFKIALVDADREGKEATFKVEKWARESWYSKTFRVRPGQGIGRPDSGDGVDYTTGRKLLSLKAKKASRTTRRREVLFDGEGRVRVESGIPLTEEVPVVDEFLEITGVLEGAGLPRREVVLEKR